MVVGHRGVITLKPGNHSLRKKRSFRALCCYQTVTPPSVVRHGPSPIFDSSNRHPGILDWEPCISVEFASLRPMLDSCGC